MNSSVFNLRTLSSTFASISAGGESVSVSIANKIRRQLCSTRSVTGTDVRWMPISLDEGTSALDPVIEQLVYTLLKDLRDLGSIVISIAHRRSMLQIADEVLTLEDGRLKKTT